MKKLSIALLAMATAVAIVPIASATSIPFGSFPLGTEIASISGTAVSVPPSFTATYSEEVYDYSGGLAFEYTVTNTTPNADVVDTFSTGYGSYANAFLALEAVSGDAVTGKYLTNAAGTITVNFTSSLGNAGIGGSGIDTSTFILFTNATVYEPDTVNFIDDAIASDGALGPAPEPSSLFLLGTGLLGLAFLVFRKSNASSGLNLHS